jgi:phosphoenolpyruvate carboxykinase (ATP)
MKIESDDRNRSLEEVGLGNLGSIHWNLPSPALYEEAIRRCGGTLSHLGPLVVRTDHYTGRLPKDKFFAREPSSEKKIWSGKINRRDRALRNW